MQARFHPNYLAIGHLCKDKNGTDYHLGGAVSYGALQALSLGCKPTIITRCSHGLSFLPELSSKGIQIINQGSENTTVFTNVYEGNERKQVVESIAANVDYDPRQILEMGPDVIHLSPIVDELNIDSIQELRGGSSLLAASIQGWLRNYNDNGIVHRIDIDYTSLDGVDLVFASHMEVSCQFYKWVDRDKDVIACLTRGSAGVSIYHSGKVWHYPAFPMPKVVDTTGAGDIFASTFTVSYYRHGDIHHAAITAIAAASLCVQDVGVHGIGSQEEINTMAQRYRARFGF